MHPWSIQLKTHGRSYVSNIRDARAEISTGQIAVTEKKGHNSLNWNVFWANEDLLERRFHAPCIGSIVWRNSQSRQRGKSVKRKVATKDNKEGGDHDVRDDWARFPLSVIDHVQHGKWNKSCMEHLHLLHEGPWRRINLKVRKSSSMTLNETLLLQCLKHKHIVEVAEIIFIQDSCRRHLLVNIYACDVVCVHEDDLLEERKRVRKRKWYANLPDIIEKQKKITRKYELKKNKVNIQGEQLCKSLYRLLWTYIWLTPLFNRCDYKIETS